MIRDKALREWVTDKDCIIGKGCSPHYMYGKRVVEAHHVKSRGAGGDDLYCVPLCRKHHQECHDTGRKTFQKKYPGVVMEKLVEILEEARNVFPQYEFEIDNQIKEIMR